MPLTNTETLNTATARLGLAINHAADAKAYALSAYHMGSEYFAGVAREELAKARAALDEAEALIIDASKTEAA